MGIVEFSRSRSDQNDFIPERFVIQEKFERIEIEIVGHGEGRIIEDVSKIVEQSLP